MIKSIAIVLFRLDNAVLKTTIEYKEGIPTDPSLDDNFYPFFPSFPLRYNC